MIHQIIYCFVLFIRSALTPLYACLQDVLTHQVSCMSGRKKKKPDAVKFIYNLSDYYKSIFKTCFVCSLDLVNHLASAATSSRQTPSASACKKRFVFDSGWLVGIGRRSMRSWLSLGTMPGWALTHGTNLGQRTAPGLIKWPSATTHRR